MSRRVSLPGAEELFRARVTPLRDDGRDQRGAGPDRGADQGGDREADGADGARAAPSDDDAPVEASGRTSHDVKITVYLTPQELLDLEQARLRLQGEFGIRVDRGRVVREAIAELLNDLHREGPDAAVVRNLS